MTNENNNDFERLQPIDLVRMFLIVRLSKALYFKEFVSPIDKRVTTSIRLISRHSNYRKP